MNSKIKEVIKKAFDDIKNRNYNIEINTSGYCPTDKEEAHIENYFYEKFRDATIEGVKEAANSCEYLEGAENEREAITFILSEMTQGWLNERPDKLTTMDNWDKIDEHVTISIKKIR